MSTSTPLYDQLLSLLSQHSRYRDWRHLKALAWMVNALICSGKINLSEWESYVVSRATKAQSIEAAHSRSSRASRRLEGIRPRMAEICPQSSNKS